MENSERHYGRVEDWVSLPNDNIRIHFTGCLIRNRTYSLTYLPDYAELQAMFKQHEVKTIGIHNRLNAIAGQWVWFTVGNINDDTHSTSLRGRSNGEAG